MRIFTDKTNGNIFVCDTRSHRSGFTHVCMWQDSNGCTYEGRAHWINRTWEAYTYETAIKAAINNRASYLLERELEDFKEARSYKAMTRKRKAEFTTYIDVCKNGPLATCCSAMDYARRLSYMWGRGDDVPTKPSYFLPYEYKTALEKE